MSSGGIPTSWFFTNTKPYVDAASRISLATSREGEEISMTGILISVSFTEPIIIKLGVNVNGSDLTLL